MWAAANSRKRAAGNSLSESEYDSDTSSDGERSTTESINENDNKHPPAAAAAAPRKPKRKRKKKATRENPEATMARLTSSYSAAMSAVGALHRLSKQYSKQFSQQDIQNRGSNSGSTERNDIHSSEADKDKVTTTPTDAAREKEATEKAHTLILRVANAARIAFEHSLLLDNIILAPIMFPMNNDDNATKTMKSNRGISARSGVKGENVLKNCASSAWFNCWNNSVDTDSISEGQWNRLNTAHRNTARQISYLALVNYADLLLSGGKCQSSSSLDCDGMMSQDTLDKGAVKKLEVLGFLQQDFTQNDVDNGASICSIWKGETRERTLRLALAAYCDASDLDPTDPTLWLKLACAARALGRECDTQASPPYNSFRCLERLALERGLASLPNGIPPNRMLLRAWNEFQAYDRLHAIDSDDILNIVAPLKDEGPYELFLELPKYSWSSLACALLEASRRETLLSNDFDFGSPLVRFRIAPILSVPPNIVKKIHKWLDRDDALNMVLACRSIANILRSQELHIIPLSTKLNSSPPACGKLDSSKALDCTEVETSDKNEANINRNIDISAIENEPNATDDIPSRRGRVSKRVQSQTITTEKQNERRAKRSSAEYCLLAGVLSTTSQNPNYRKLIKKVISWEDLPIMKQHASRTQVLSPAKVDSKQQASATLSLQNQSNTNSPSSLSTFIKQVSKNNGPNDVLEQFLAYVSLHVSDVFASEDSDSLPSYIIESFDAIVDRSHSCCEMNSSWFGEEETNEATSTLERVLSVVSINLLVAELRFKRCECSDAGDHSNDEFKLDFILPILMRCISSTSHYDASNDQMIIIHELTCRYHWLVSTYYTWLGHRCSDILASKDADELSLKHLDSCIECLSKYQQFAGEQSIKTLHLASPDHRHGNHWDSLSVDTLTNYKQYLLSTAVVTNIRQQFHNISCQLKEVTFSNKEPSSITEEQKSNLASLATQLINRYKGGLDRSREKIEELLHDFILTHGAHLVPNDDWEITPSSTGEHIWGNAWSVLPSTQIESIEQISSISLSSPSIMQVLSCSLLLSNGEMKTLIPIYTQLISFALESRSRILQSSAEDRFQRGNLMLLASKLFVDKLADMMCPNSSKEYLKLEDDALDEITVLSVIHLYQNISSSETNEEANDQCCVHLSRNHMFHSTARFVLGIQNCEGVSLEKMNDIESTYFVGLVKTLINLKIEFAELYNSASDKRLKSWQRQLGNLAGKICFVANEVAELMSKCTTCVDSTGNARVSHLMKGLVGLEDVQHNQKDFVTVGTLAQLSESLLWLWKFIKKAEASSPAENSVKDQLLVPVCAALIALCGSPGVSVDFASSIYGRNEYSAENSNYFDSDNSVNGVFLPDDTSENELQYSKRTLVRKYCQLTQCISLVYEFSERAACKEDCYPSSQHGPFLSLVTMRTLSSMADNIYALFSEDIWNDWWPYGVRQCGFTLDSTLSKAYSSIYGFSLTGQVLNNDSSKRYAPESVVAAAQIFRCVKRIFNQHNRRSPPTKAFEVMEMALPQLEENAVKKAIRDFMFDPNKDVDAVRFCRLDTPSGFPEWVFYETNVATSPRDKDGDCAEILRRGISQELAKCPISHMDSNDVGEGNEGLSEERESTQRYELSLGRKFRAVMDDISYNPRNIENWMTLSECLGFKADIISDRLVRNNDPYEPSGFCPPLQPRKKMSLRSLSELQETQFEEYTRRKWHPYIGTDLSPYIQYPWSNLNSLRDFSSYIQLSLSDNPDSTDESETMDLQIWNEIELIFEKGDYTSWANAWAGMFVTALRTMRMKALRVARYLAKKKLGKMHPSEVCEDIGTALYGDLMASTVYGFPMKNLDNYEKRAIAEGTKFYFEEAIESSKSIDYDCDSKTESWEVQLMIGKCCEKIASTLREEIYQGNNTDKRRVYETRMSEAIQNYSAALVDAQNVEKSSGGQDNKNGGSSHGSREVLYRLHTARFKALLLAIQNAAEIGELAEIEAHRISSTSWFDAKNELVTSSEDIRGKSWDLYVDCVQGLASCRKGISYFHRAAYRLAQALHWAPAFHDTSFCYRSCNTEVIPLLKRERISELDRVSFAECAENVIVSLFDKKRPHLVAVWVTTSAAPPPFEVLNDSVRKYDSLRLKYIRAYIDTMVLCNRRDRIETFLSWAASSSQDLPGFYEASAQSFKGGNVEKSLLFSSGFLGKVIRTSTAALAKMILVDLAQMKKDGMNEESRKLLKDDFKLSYNIFLRLRSTPEDVLRAVRMNIPLDEVVAFCRCYLSVQSGRINDSINLDSNIDGTMLSSLLDGAIEKVKQMFPMKKNKLKTQKRQAEQDPANLK